MKFDNLEEFELAFQQNETQLTDSVCINEVIFEYVVGQDYTNMDLLASGNGVISKKIFISEDSTKAITLMWGIEDHLLKPQRVVETTFTPDVTNEEQKVGYDCDVTFHGIGGAEPITAKIDTGATYSSLHATNIKQHGDTVSFNTIFGNKTQMLITGTQNVKSADGGVEQRPLVTFDVTIDEGKRLNNMQFNLNDRSNMEYKILIGRNIINSADLSINPEEKTKEEIGEAILAEVNQIIDDESQCDEKEKLNTQLEIAEQVVEKLKDTLAQLPDNKDDE